MLLGADVLSVSISGITIRIVQLLLMIMAVYMFVSNRYVIDIKIGLAFSPIILSHILSSFVSYDLKKSILFTLWVIFTLVCVIYVIYSWAKNKNLEWLMHTYIKVFRVVVILSILHFIILSMGLHVPLLKNDFYMGIGRPSLWFYEPSYLATYMTLYYGISIYMYIIGDQKKYRIDLIMSVVCIMFTTSTTGYLSLILGFGMILIINLRKAIAARKQIKKSKIDKSKYKNILSLIIILVVGLCIIYIVNKDILEVFIGRLFSRGIVASSGDRIQGFGLPLEIYTQYPILGIGPGAFENFANEIVPPTNVTLEILCTLGIVGALSFAISSTYLYIYQDKVKDNNVKAMGFSLILFTLTLQANQNYLRIYMWGHIALFIAMIYIAKNNKDKSLGMKKIYVDCRMHDMSGIGRYIRNVLYDNTNLKSMIFLGNKKDLEVVYSNEVIEYNSKIYGIKEQLQFPYLQVYSNSVLHVPHYNIPLLYTGSLVTTIHDITHVLFPEYLPNKFALYYAKFMIKMAILRSEYILTVSENTKYDLVKHFNANPDKIIVTYNGVDSSFENKDSEEYEYLYDKYKIDKSKKILLYVGNKKPHKNIGRLIKAVSIINQDNDEYRLVLSGKDFDGYTELEELTNTLNMKNKIIHTGLVTDEELVLLYNLADLFVFPSLYEGFGIPALESMACGTPVVCSNSSSLPEVVEDAACTVDSYSEESIANGIKSVLNDNIYYDELIVKGYKQAQKFTWKECREKTEDIYSKVLEL